jgi:hypothetical protein
MPNWRNVPDMSPPAKLTILEVTLRSSLLARQHVMMNHPCAYHALESSIKNE